MDNEYWKRREFIEFCFRRETKIKQAIIEKRLDPNLPRSVGHGSGISKPTEIQAMNNLTPLAEVAVDGVRIWLPDLWLVVVALTKAHYNYKQGGELYALRYRETKENEEDITRKDVLEKMKISKTRYHQLIIEIIDYAMGEADKRNLKYSIVKE